MFSHKGARLGHIFLLALKMPMYGECEQKLQNMVPSTKVVLDIRRPVLQSYKHLLIHDLRIDPILLACQNVRTCKGPGSFS